MKHTENRSGFASFLALMLLVVMAILGVSFAAYTNTNLLRSANQTNIHHSLLQAESGIDFLAYEFRNIRLPAGLTGQDMFNALGTVLATRLNGSGNLRGGNIVATPSSIAIPHIVTDEHGHGFRAVITPIPGSDRTVHVWVTGDHGTVCRAVGMDFELSTRRSSIFDYGIASKSAVQLTGNASVRGANNAAEANILSGTYSTSEAFNITGNCNIQGDIYAANPDAHATLTGNVTIGGKGLNDPAINDHIHIGEGGTDFPEVAPTVFEPFATNIVDASTPTSGNKTFTNIRIKANANPTFSGNITINGVVFVEQPNKVQFSGNLNFTGLLVTQDAGDNAYTTNTVKFTGNTTSRGVESLPDTPEFHDLRQMPGSFILAPGFGVSFTGNFGTVNGCMAADAFSFTGNAGGVVKGPIINYSDSTFSLTGNSQVVIDRLNSPSEPPGFSSRGSLRADSSTYVEY